MKMKKIRMFLFIFRENERRLKGLPNGALDSLHFKLNGRQRIRDRIKKVIKMGKNITRCSTDVLLVCS
jgi:hypothetical protein